MQSATKTLLGIFVILMVFTMSGRSQLQTFQLTVPLSGYLTMSAQDLDGQAGSSGAFQLNFNTLSETVYVDSDSNTIRQVGTISYTPSATNIQFQDNQEISNADVTGNVTVNLSPSGGNLSFDTGTQSLDWDASLSAYTDEANCWIPSGIPMSGSYSLVTGGKTYTGSFSYTLYYAPVTITAYTFSRVALPDYPSSVELWGLGTGYGELSVFGSPGIVADVKATNGLEMKLSPGAENDGNGNGELFLWGVASTVTASNVAGVAANITAQPLSLVVYVDSAASFSVTAGGTAPLGYQWLFNNTNIPGAIYSNLMFSNVVQTNLGTYTVLVTNAFGMALSSNAVLSMYPYIATPFTGAVTYWGKNATFNIEACGSGPLIYQWFQNGVALPNATNQSLSLMSIQATNAGLYSVVVSNAFGSATNPPAQVVVEPAGVSVGLYPGVTINGVVGYNYVIQSTTDLANTNSWITETNVTLTDPIELWIDTNTDASQPGNPFRYYQVLPGQ
jgi:hypothetical protein